MLNFFKPYKKYVHILNHIFDLAWPRPMKLTLEQQYMLFVLHSQYHACWCSGDFRSQCIGSRGINPQSQNIPSPASDELMIYMNLQGLLKNYQLLLTCNKVFKIFCYFVVFYHLLFFVKWYDYLQINSSQLNNVTM